VGGFVVVLVVVVVGGFVFGFGFGVILVGLMLVAFELGFIIVLGIVTFKLGVEIVKVIPLLGESDGNPENCAKA